ncbi:MAG TPA: TonB-dependent receptor [Flavipsychrobacter sp.]|nr:TonB-dependent receptor [Flavipsychrobacter sp.]
MVRSLRYLFLLVLVAAAGSVYAQSGAIQGTVYDETKQPVIGAIVEVSLGGTVRGGAATDEDGKYIIKPLNPSTEYQISVKFTGYQEILLTKVQVTPDRTTYQNFNLKVASNERTEVNVIEYKVPLIDKGKPPTTTTFTGDQIKKMATINTNDIASLSAGTYQQKNGAALSLGGGRTSGTLYIIDGIQVNGADATNFAPGAIEQMSVSTSGLRAKFGDATGGVVSITTRGPSPKTMGDVRAEHSVDGYNHNLISFNLSGPLLKKRDSSGNSRPLLGYAIGGQYQYDADNNPNFYDNYVVKEDVLNSMRERPLVAVPGGSGSTPTLVYAAENVTMNDLEVRKQRVNAENQNAKVNAKIDYQVTDNANITAGGNFSYSKYRDYSRAYSLFAPEAMPARKFYNARGFLRFTQRLGKPNLNPEEGAKPPTISNAYYSVQADYQVNHMELSDPNHKQNPFLYNYLGKYDINFDTIYNNLTYDSTLGIIMTGPSTYNAQNGINFQSSGDNPYLSNYTKTVFDIRGSNSPLTLDELQQSRGLLNGQQPSNIYSSYFNVGRTLTGFNYSNEEQFAFNVDASFDLQAGKTRHAIEFGLYYQQRSERFYSFNRSGDVSIWNVMRLSANQHLLSFDFDKPTYVKNGIKYTKEQVQNGEVIIGSNDTVFYERRFDAGVQSTFSKNLRTKMGLDPNGLDYLNVDNMDPSLFSLDMFSPDELLNQGSSFINYYGYDYTGKRVNGQVNFNDWFTKKDENGNYTREVGAFRPNYIAGYIMDGFELANNTRFDIGVRVERFDANTKVLKDPYSLYEVHTVGSNPGAVNYLNGGTNPTNMGSEYVVYVKDNSSVTPEIVGYRNGDDWFDPYGRPLADPKLISDLYTGGIPPQPFLQRNNGQTGSSARALTMRDSSYNPNSSFTDYKPQVNVMPRFSFTFPIADQSMFYAHYDVIVQRPKEAGQIYATPYDYYYLQQNASNIIANPNLKPEKMFDYELGFQQALNKYSAVTVTGFYKERKDMIQVRPYLYAWPTTYYTYGNRDFSTTKGFLFKYDLRRVNHVSAFISYSLQFAEGTASNAQDGNGGRTDGTVATGGLLQNLIGASLPNLRFTYPLNIDSRHILNANIDYRFDKGEGPLVGKSHILENAGANLIFRARSGEPYTRRLNAISGSTTIIGGVQNSRLPWHYMMDLRVDKQFDIYFGKKGDDDAAKRKSLGLMAFVYIQNLLNTRDVLDVFRYTGRPDDDGFLASDAGQQIANQQVNTQSYTDLYRLNNMNPANLNNPRTVNIGLQVNF